MVSPRHNNEEEKEHEEGVGEEWQPVALQEKERGQHWQHEQISNGVGEEQVVRLARCDVEAW